LHDFDKELDKNFDAKKVKVFFSKILQKKEQFSAKAEKFI